MKTRLQRWDGGLIVHIPDDVADKMALNEGTDVELDLEGDALVLRSADQPHMTLEDLLAQITPENIHEEVDWGKPRGNEIIPCVTRHIEAI